MSDDGLYARLAKLQFHQQLQLRDAEYGSA
jgi:hypothetical protein